MEVTRIYHSAILTGILAYGAGVWAHTARKVKHIQLLRKIQRQLLLRCLGIVSTTSTMAIMVALAIWPIDVTIRKKGAMFWIKRKEYEKTRNVIRKLCISAREVKEILITEWQREWNSVTTGRKTYNFFPNIRDRLKLKTIQPNKEGIQYITGHGPFDTYFKKIGKYENDKCNVCNVQGTPEHTLFECIKHKTYYTKID